MSAYTRCPNCGECGMDVDTFVHKRDDGTVCYSPDQEVEQAVARERARCARIVADLIDGGTDVPRIRHVGDSELSEMIREIEEGKCRRP